MPEQNNSEQDSFRVVEMLLVFLVAYTMIAILLIK